MEIRDKNWTKNNPGFKHNPGSIQDWISKPGPKKK